MSCEGPYHERNQLVACLSKLFPAHLSRHPDSDSSWEDDWRWIVCIHPPGDLNTPKQMSWHIHDSEKDLFKHLALEANDWDGHTTEEKYQRLLDLHLTV